MDVKNQHWYTIEQKVFVLISYFALLVLLNIMGIINWTIPCFVEHFFSFECFGCGTTKAIELALVGELDASLSKNPLGLVVLAYIFSKIIYLIHSKLY